MFRASIDIGSNSILLLIAEISESSFVEKENISRITALGKGLDETNLFSNRSMQDSLIVLHEYFEVLKDYNISPIDVIVTATEASRVAKNAKPFFEQVKEKFGFIVNIISEEGEAYYTALGISKFNKEHEKLTIIDIGGASSEIILLEREPFKLLDFISLPVGAVRANDWYSHGIFEKQMKELLENNNISDFTSDYLIYSAGTMTSLGAMIKNLQEYDDSIVNNTVISVDDLESYHNSYKNISNRQLLEKYPFLEKRVHTIKSGVSIALKLANALKSSKISITTSGLRYGTVFAGKISSKFLI